MYMQVIKQLQDPNVLSLHRSCLFRCNPTIKLQVPSNLNGLLCLFHCFWSQTKELLVPRYLKLQQRQNMGTQLPCRSCLFQCNPTMKLQVPSNLNGLMCLFRWFWSRTKVLFIARYLQLHQHPPTPENRNLVTMVTPSYIVI